MWIFTILISASALLMGLTIIIRNPNLQENRYFFLLNLLASFWVLSNYFASFMGHKYAGPLVGIDFGTAIGMSYIMFFFSATFTGIFKNKQKFILYKIFALAILLSIEFIVLFTTLVIKKIVITSAGIDVVPGALYVVYTLLLILPIVASAYFFLSSYYRSNILKKIQIKFIAFGIMLAAFILIITNLVLPRFISSIALATIVQESGYLGLITFLGLTTYAMIRHKLMDIRFVVARSATYAILLISLASLYIGSVLGIERIVFPQYYNQFNLAQGIVRAAVSVIMVFLFQPLRKWITQITDRIFFKNQYNQDDLLSELSNTMGSTIVLVELLYKVGDIVTNNLKSSRVLFALIRDDSRMYASQGIGYKKTPDVDPKDVIKLTKDGMICADDLAEGSRIKHLMREYQATLAIPLKTEQEIVGLMFLGEKNSGDMYSQQDLSVLEILAPELAIAIENAKSYEEISRFNTTLRQEVKRATYRLKQKNEQLMELDHAKDEFISMASHQLRTPLTAIKGYLSMLLEGDAGDIKVSQYDFINEAYSGANRMVGLINDLLNVSRMDTGRFFLEPKDVDIEKVVGEEVKQLSNSAKAKGLYLKIETKGKIPHIYADETKIRQVVMNFMDNAIYYTNTGGVTVVLRSDRQNFIYEVHDTGIGVPKSQRDHLFEKFFRADNARTARPDGTGLGIYLAKRVVADHGGEIIFESTEGKGSVFGFKFPLKKKPIPTLTSAPVPKRVTPPATMPKATDIAAKHIGE